MSTTVTAAEAAEQARIVRDVRLFHAGLLAPADGARVRSYLAYQAARLGSEAAVADMLVSWRVPRDEQLYPFAYAGTGARGEVAATIDVAASHNRRSPGSYTLLSPVPVPR